VAVVADDRECALTEYSAGAPVINVAQPLFLRASALVANAAVPFLCFFEIAESTPLVIGEINIQQEAAPPWGLVIEEVLNEYIHRGLAVNLLLGSVAPGEQAQVFMLSETRYAANEDRCIPPQPVTVDFDTGVAIGQSARSYVNDYIETFAVSFESPLKNVSLMPAANVDFTHFVWLSELDTNQFAIGQEYYVCYTPDRTAPIRIFNALRTPLRVKNIITAVYRDDLDLEKQGRNGTSSRQVNLLVSASLRGTVSCMASLSRGRQKVTREDIEGTVPSFVTVQDRNVDPNDILGRTVGVAATERGNVSVVVVLNQTRIQRIPVMPIGEPPRVYAWCSHERSAIVYPDDADGELIPLDVLDPPPMQYERGAGPGLAVEIVTLVRGVRFSPLIRVYLEQPDFPVIYYDMVRYSVVPPLPAGIEMSGEGNLQTPLTPSALSPDPITYSVTATSREDTFKASSVDFSMSVRESVTCNLLNAKTTDITGQCTINDADNFISEQVFMLISQATLPLTFDVSAFQECYTPSVFLTRAPEAGTTVDMLCQQTSDPGRCCCGTTFPWKDVVQADRNVRVPKQLTVRARNMDCGWAFYSKYVTQYMVVGQQPEFSTETVVVSNSIFEFTVPPRPAAEPLTFELKLDIPWDQCNPEIVGTAGAEKCKQTLALETAELLGASVDQIVITNIRDGTDVPR